VLGHGTVPLPLSAGPFGSGRAGRTLGQFLNFALKRISMHNVGMRSERLIPSMALVFTLAIALSPVATQSAQAQTFTLLYTFTGGADGGLPQAGLVLDSAGNLYGTTDQGGSALRCQNGCGTVFKLDTAGHETVLHRFAGNKDGAVPACDRLLRDGAGNLYGTTSQGGTFSVGTIFRVGPTGKEAVVAFSGGANGGFPLSGLVADTAGNAYGTTFSRGSGCPPQGCGTVFKVNSAGEETALYSFTGGTDGGTPEAGLVRDGTGNLYGTTRLGGGAHNAGTVFKVDSTGKETVLYSFTDGADGGFPYAGLVRDSAGNLFGTTLAGGTSGGGTVFKVDSAGKETVLYSFTNGADGGYPYAGLVRDGAGNLYGTTSTGGAHFSGTVFKVDSTGKETVLHSFTNGADGGYPYAGLVRDGAGSLYGTTSTGGAYFLGTVFKIIP
jgi:uncharacterized repeat protein (TIGR03803 family)